VWWWQWQQTEKAAVAWPSTRGRRRGSGPRLGRKAEWAGHAWQADFRKETKKIGRAARGFLGQNQIGPPEENKNCFRFSDSREWDSNQKI
jgi:hypothetical protein